MLYPAAEEFHKTNKKSSGKNRQEYIVMHYTAGSSGESSVRSLSIGAAKASAHFVVYRSGKVVQIGDTDDILWHAGKSFWDGKSGLNKYSIGIEIDNPGILENKGGKYVSWFSKVYDTNDLIITDGGRNAYLPYTTNQIESVMSLAEWIIRSHPTIKEVVGHQNIAPKRKIDPGNGIIFDQKIYDRLNWMIKKGTFDDAKVENDTLAVGDQFMVKVKTKLNARSGPGPEFSIKTKYPNGQIGYVQKVLGSWVLDMNGNWLHSAYLEKL